MDSRSRLVTALATILVVAGCGRRGKDGETKVPTVVVQPSNVVRVESRRLEAGIPFTGELVPSESVDITARFDGDLEVVLVREGQKVRKGQPLARYKPREFTDNLESARAGLQAAEADLAAAESAVRRAKRLVEAGASAPAQLETAEAQRSAAEARVRAARAELNSAEEDTEKLDVPSPVDGAVSRLYVNSGSRTAVGDKMMTIVDTHDMELSATVPSEALSHVQPGTPVEFRVDAFPGETFHGRVDRLSPTTEPGTRQVRAYTRIANPDGRLVGGLFASGRVLRAVKENVTTAPHTVLRQEGTEQVVYRMARGSAERVPVTLGLVDEAAGIVELQGAVAPGDSLLAGVLPGLRPGARVRILAATDSADVVRGANGAAGAPHAAGR